MDHVDYFKLQAKNLLKDYKTRYYDEKQKLYFYHPTYFFIDDIFLSFGINDDKDDFSFSLMNAQHLIAKMAGFNKWNDLIKSNPYKLELSHLLFDNTYKINLEEWEIYVQLIEKERKEILNDEEKLNIFQQVFLNGEDQRSDFICFRIDLEEKRKIPLKIINNQDNIKIENIYEEVSSEESLKAIHNYFYNFKKFTLNETVECLHCGNSFKFKESKVIKLKSEYQTETDFNKIVCKNYPNCSGTLIDFIHFRFEGGNK